MVEYSDYYYDDKKITEITVFDVINMIDESMGLLTTNRLINTLGLMRSN